MLSDAQKNVEYWVTRLGLLPGGVPNGLRFLYRKYCRWLSREFGDDAPMPYKTFRESLLATKFTLGRAGNQIVVYGNKDVIRGRKKAAKSRSSNPIK